MKSILLFFLIFLISASYGQTDDELFKKANDLLYESKIDESFEIYQQLLNKEPKNHKYLRGNAFVYLIKGEFQKSIELNKKAIKYKSDCYNCYCNIARGFALTQQLDSALFYVNKAIELDENNTIGYTLRGEIKEEKGEIFGAMIDYEKTIKLEPDNPEHYIKRATFNFYQGYDALTEKDLTKAIELAPENDTVINTRVRFYSSLGKWEKALKDVNKCIEINPNNSEYFSTRGAIYVQLNNTEKGMADLNKAIELDPENYYAYSNKADLHYTLENMDKYCECAKQAIDIIDKDEPQEHILKNQRIQYNETCNPEHLGYYFHRGWSAYLNENYEESIKHISAGLKIFPDDPMMLNTLGLAYLETDRFDEARKCFEKSIQFEDEMDKSLSVFHMNHDERARKVAAQGIFLQNYYGLGIIEFLNEDFEKALVNTNKAIDISIQIGNHPFISEIYNLRGKIFIQFQMYREALNDFDKAIKLNGNFALPYVNKAFCIILQSNREKVKQFTFSYQGNRTKNMSFRIPKVQINEDAEANLYRAIDLCNTAITIEDDLAYAYLMRAQLKILLNISDYCVDAYKAKELGIEDALEQLGVECE